MQAVQLLLDSDNFFSEIYYLFQSDATWRSGVPQHTMEEEEVLAGLP